MKKFLFFFLILISNNVYAMRSPLCHKVKCQEDINSINECMSWRLDEFRVIMAKLASRNSNIRKIFYEVYSLNESGVNGAESGDPYFYVEFLEYNIKQLGIKLNLEEIEVIASTHIKPLYLALALRNEYAIIKLLNIEKTNLAPNIEPEFLEEKFSESCIYLFDYLFRRYITLYQRHIEYEPNYKELYKWIKFLVENGVALPQKIYGASIIESLASKFENKYTQDVLNLINFLCRRANYKITIDDLRAFNSSRIIIDHLKQLLAEQQRTN